MIIGVTGYFAAGKDSFAEVLMRKGFHHISLSDIIRDDIRASGQRVTIPRLTRVGNELRDAGGPGVLSVRALQVLPENGNSVVTSIRHPAEVEALRSGRPDFAMIFIDAPIKVRFQRSLKRNRGGDLKTLEAFRAAERLQKHPTDPNAQDLLSCKKMADLVISNAGTAEAFEKKITNALKRIFMEFTPARPTWDAYFMRLASVAATRSNCIKRHIGAIITQDQRLISTGYNGTPKGIKNCFEGGCPRCMGMADSGSALGECLCVHAEENAILQAACHGISIKGSTLYTTFCPCSYCAKSIINAGIAKVVYSESYAMDKVTRALFSEAGVEFHCTEEEAAD